MHRSLKIILLLFVLLLLWLALNYRQIIAYGTIWNETALVTTQPSHWWEIAPSLNMGFQNGRTKQFELGSIQIYADAH